MKVLKSEIKSYIPHREPFIMIDNLLDIQGDTYYSDFTIDKDNLFLHNGFFKAYGIIESICQTGAAGLSYSQQNSSNRFKDGFLGGIKNLHISNLPKVGDKINIKVTLLRQFENLYLMKGETFLEAKSLLSCEVKLAGI